MKKLQSEQEFYRSLGHAMRKMRRHMKFSPYYVGRMKERMVCCIMKWNAAALRRHRIRSIVL